MQCNCLRHNPDSKVHGANMGPTWVLSAPDGSHVGPINLAIREGINNNRFPYFNVLNHFRSEKMSLRCITFSWNLIISTWITDISTQNPHPGPDQCQTLPLSFYVRPVSANTKGRRLNVSDVKLGGLETCFRLRPLGVDMHGVTKELGIFQIKMCACEYLH